MQRLKDASLTGPALVGVAAALLVTPLLPFLKPLFPIPGHGIGWVTVNRYPKGWDYAVVIILFVVAAAATWCSAGLWPALKAGEDAGTTRAPHSKLIVVLMLVVGFGLFPARDHPYEFADPYHEGENLSPLSVMMSGETL